MRKVAIKGLVARPVRTILTTLAIVLGVAMVSGAFTLTDTMRGGADGLTHAAYDGTDAVVTGRTAFKVESTDWATRKPTIAASSWSACAPSRRWPPPSATSATRRRSSPATASRPATARTSASASTAASRAPPKTTPFRLDDGRWATGPGEVVIDASTASKEKYRVGSTVKITAAGKAATTRSWASPASAP